MVEADGELHLTKYQVSLPSVFIDFAEAGPEKKVRARDWGDNEMIGKAVLRKN